MLSLMQPCIGSDGQDFTPHLHPRVDSGQTRNIPSAEIGLTNSSTDLEVTVSQASRGDW